jgi:hypothetical protein
MRHLLHFFVPRVLAAKAAVFSQLDPVRIVLFVLHRRVVSAFAIVTRYRNDVPHLASTPFTRPSTLATRHSADALLRLP